MIQETFYYILDLVKNRLMKNWCNWHKQPILPEERLVVTIHFISSTSIESTRFNFFLPEQWRGSTLLEINILEYHGHHQLTNNQYNVWKLE
ncbi:hypothetical protein evm_002284 [Chilo suppressalis]|nr:hypothetical protein evm_002284 [Chilo suppressalis]